MSELPEFLKSITPHKLTRRGAARMAVRHEVDPLTGQLTGHRYVDPIIIAGLEQQGYDPAPLVRALLEADAESDD